MLTIADVSKSYGTRTLFEGVSLFIDRDDRLGLVGANGAGKTTLFNLILGNENPDEGSITWQRGSDFGYLPQESMPVGDETILDITLGRLEKKAGEEELHSEDYTREPRAKRILSGLGFKEEDHGKPAKTFSGGWIMRAHIARLLLAEPSLLLLDEPTNHLDLQALLWLQDYLTRYPGGLVVISHDRAFLNALCTGILEISGCSVERYTGNYDSYLEQRELRHEQQLALFKNQQREIAHLQKFVDRFGSKASLASRANSRKKQIERLTEEAIEAPERDLRKINFRFPQPPRSGQRVITLEKVYQAYGDHVVYPGDLSLRLERGQRIVLVGPNGAGKSTLLKILAGVIPIQGGICELGHNVTVDYFAQNRTDTLNVKATVLENMMELRTAQNDLTEQRARSILGAFLFRKDDVFKKVSVLSGGEKSRLALARMLVNPPNFLLMDEPTTHLDMQSIDALTLALSQFEGCLVFISHDVYFIRSLAKTVLHISAGKVTEYAGDYDYYLDKSRAGDARAALVSAGFTDARPKAKPEESVQGNAAYRGGPKSKEQKRLEAQMRAKRSGPMRDLRNRIKKLEEKIAALEARQAEITALLELPETHEDPARVKQASAELLSATREVEISISEWELATQEYEEMEKTEL